MKTLLAELAAKEDTLTEMKSLRLRSNKRMK